jgi:hypothetical protein
VQPLKVLSDKSKDMNASDFAASYPEPALLLTLPAQDDDDDSDLDSTITTMVLGSPEELDKGKTKDWIAWIAKTNRNKFADIVILGRSSIADILVPVKTVSSIHASFTKIGDGWRVVHRGATNGVKLNGEALPAEDYAPLATGDQLRFGPDVRCVFLDAGAIYTYLQK